jgi:hypothetical protein
MLLRVVARMLMLGPMTCVRPRRHGERTQFQVERRGGPTRHEACRHQQAQQQQGREQ